MHTPIMPTALAVLALGAGLVAQTSIADDSRAFELRTYTAAPGKTAALHARFRDHTDALFDKHGMTVVGYWIPEDDADVLVYLLAHRDRRTATASWDAFRVDPVWISAKDASEVDGPLTAKVESTFLSATDYSPMK